MSIYKGGYILADISDIPLSNENRDLLPQELKDYLSRFIINSEWSKEVLMKPLILLVKDVYGFTFRAEFNKITDDDYSIVANYINGSVSVFVQIDSDLTISSGNVELA